MRQRNHGPAAYFRRLPPHTLRSCRRSTSRETGLNNGGFAMHQVPTVRNSAATGRRDSAPGSGKLLAACRRCWKCHVNVAGFAYVRLQLLCPTPDIPCTSVCHLPSQRSPSPSLVLPCRTGAANALRYCGSNLALKNATVDLYLGCAPGYMRCDSNCRASVFFFSAIPRFT